MKPLAEILAQLKQEPEWSIVPVVGGVWLYCGNKVLKRFSANNWPVAKKDTKHAVKVHNATRARLLAVVEALEMGLKIAQDWHGMGEDEYMAKITWQFYQKSPEMSAITAKLAAALEQ